MAENYRELLLKGRAGQQQTDDQQTDQPDAEQLAFGEKDVERALEKLKEYKRGKVSIDHKATENQEWWRLRHWNVLSDVKKEGDREVGSAWTFNSIINKHADMMDSFPKPNVLPRDIEDEEEARILSKILPVIQEENEYENTYSRGCYELLIDGGMITGVFWDNSKADGLGDIAIKNVDVHNVFWQPGINNIQDGEYFFHVSLEDTEAAKLQWPEYAEKIQPHDPGDVVKYIHDDDIDTSKCVEVVDCYYKKRVMEVATDAEGNEIVTVPKDILHLAKIVGGQMVFCSENEAGYEDGYYWHGMYPFVVRVMFPVKDTPWGFGYLDVMKHPQRDIDNLDQAIIKNAMMKATPRFWVKKNSGINWEDFADWSKDIVEVASGDLGAAIKQMDVDSVPASAMNHMVNKIDELKETSGNRDFSQGSAASGVTAASAIAALQEAGSKLSRDLNKTAYRGTREEYYLVVELIRQFYTEERSFRIESEDGGYEFARYSNEGLQPYEDSYMGGYKRRKPVFDIEITAEKQSPFSRAAQNETAKEMYGMGLFQPENAQAALVCINMMEFEGKESIKRQIQDNNTFLQQFQQMQEAIMQFAPMIPELPVMAGLVDPMQMQMAMQQQAAQAPAPGGGDMKGTPEERAARKNSDSTLAAKARLKAANQASI